MSILKVARMGHPVLREKAQRLERADLRKPPMQKLIDDMIETMHEYHGVGLAAPQIHEGVRIFVAVFDDEGDGNGDPVAIVNPEIIPNDPGREGGWEGCLSIPDVRGLVPRFTDITLKGLDRTGHAVELNLRKFAARVAQHETDHLDGVLFLDRMQSLQSLTFIDEYSRYWSKDDE
jgi:peptide deformylase